MCNKCILKSGKPKNVSGQKKLVEIHEEYDDRIKDKMDTIESQFDRYISGKLQTINSKARYFVSSKLRSVTKSIDQELTEYFAGDFVFNLNDLIPLLLVASSYQQEIIATELISLGTTAEEVAVQLGINFSPPTVKYTEFLLSRERYLREVLEETTIKKIENIIRKGLQEGKTYEEIADRLSRSLGMNGTRAYLIATTEANYALNEGTRLYVKDLGVTEYQVSLAGTACPVCRAAAKRTYSIDEMVFPIHPRCRCVLKSVIPREWYDTI
jgi:SPP1 gp7 family putative phage head morphogenesis protein